MSQLTPDQIKSLKPGDRVRITVEGEVTSSASEGFIGLRFDGCKLAETEYCFEISELTAPTASVTLLPPPIDPDLVLAREVVALTLEIQGDLETAQKVCEGECDFEAVIQSLAAIRAANARIKA
jgi:hypothetical protein